MEGLSEQNDPHFSLSNCLARANGEKFEGLPYELEDEIQFLIEQLSDHGITFVEFQKCYAVCKVVERQREHGKDFDRAILRETVRAAVANLLTASKKQKIKEIIDGINNHKFVLVCSFISVVVCAYLSQRGIAAKVSRNESIDLSYVSTEEYGDISPWRMWCDLPEIEILSS